MLNTVKTLFRGLAASLGEYVRAQPLVAALAGLAITLLASFFLLLGTLGPSAPGSEVPLTRVLDAARQGQVVRATILDEDAQVEVLLRSGQQVYASFPRSEGQTGRIIDALGRGRAQVSVDQQAGKPTLRVIVQFLLPILILVTLFTLFTLLAKGSGGASAFAAFSKFAGKGRKGHERDPNAVTFKDVAGVPEAIEELREIVDYLEDPSKYHALGAMAPKGVLLAGPPGTGKTLLAKAVAGEASATFYSVSASEFVESLVGVGAARVRDLFRQAREQAPAIIFIDELDAAGRQRGAGVGQGNDEREQTLNQLLVEMDGFSGELGVCVMAATNRPDVLDAALLRPGRFDRQVVVDTPDIHGREAILGLYSKGKRLAAGVSLAPIAQMTPGFTGAELANVINEATLLAVRAGRPEIEQPDLEEAIERVVSGPQRRSHVLTRREKEVIAIHEAAHAVAARAAGEDAASQKVSIVARGRNLGSATVYASADKVVLQRDDLLQQMVVTLAGAAGEQRWFGQPSSGVSADLDRASKLARTMVTSYGMSREFGFVSTGEAGAGLFLGRDIQTMGHESPAQQEMIESEVRRMIGEAMDVATAILDQNEATVEQMVRTLVEQETLSGVALEAILSSVLPWDGALRPT